jgi:SAM-dependent methyltransferase
VRAADASALAGRNRRFYETFWSDTALVEPSRFNTWPLVSGLAASGPRCLEIGPGLRPRLPIPGSWFVDVSAAAAAELRRRGGHAARGDARALPFPDGSFDVVCALDVVEHVDDDRAVFAELRRVLAPHGTLVLSTPLHATSWTVFDEVVGHWRRYDPATLVATLARHGLVIERSAAYGMQPRSRLLARLGAWWLTHHRAHAMRWYNQVFMPIGLLLERALTFGSGLIDTARVDEILLVCRRAMPDVSA